MTTAEEKALRLQVSALEKKLELMKELSSITGFFSFYFKLLHTSSSNIEAFNKVNDLYHELFGNYRYSDYNSFKQMVRYHFKIKK